MTLWYVFRSDRGAIAVDKRGAIRAADPLALLTAAGLTDHGLYTLLWPAGGGLSIEYTDPCPQLAAVAPCSPADFAALALLTVDGLISGS